MPADWPKSSNAPGLPVMAGDDVVLSTPRPTGSRPGPGRGRRDGRLRRCWSHGTSMFRRRFHPDGSRFSSSFTITGSPGAFVDLGESSLGIDSGSQTISVPLKELGPLEIRHGHADLTGQIATTQSSQSSTGVRFLWVNTALGAGLFPYAGRRDTADSRSTGSPSPTPSTLRDKEQPRIRRRQKPLHLSGPITDPSNGVPTPSGWQS